jgi:hypothetical protein
MPPLLPKWLTVLTRLGFNGNVRRTLARAHCITSLNDLSVYSYEDVHNIFKQLRTALIVPQIVEVWTLVLTRYDAHVANLDQLLDPALATKQFLANEALVSEASK